MTPGNLYRWIIEESARLRAERQSRGYAFQIEAIRKRAYVTSAKDTRSEARRAEQARDFYDSKD